MANYSLNKIEMENIGNEKNLFKDQQFNLSEIIDTDDNFQWVSDTEIETNSIKFRGFKDITLSVETLIKMSKVFKDREIVYTFSREYEGCDRPHYTQKYLNGEQVENTVSEFGDYELESM